MTRIRIGTAALLTLAAGILALAVLIPARRQQVLVGQPGDAAAVAGFSLASSYEGHPGRWSRGDARVAFPDCPVPAAATLTLATVPERLPDTIEIVANDGRPLRVTLTGVRQTVEVPVPMRRRAAPTTISVRSTTTSRGTVPQGIFVEQVTLTTGGFRASLGVRPAAWASVTASFAAFMLATAFLLRGGRSGAGGAPGGAASAGSAGDSQSAGVTAGAGARAMLFGGSVALGVLAAVVFRPALLAQAPVVAVAMIVGAVAIAMAETQVLRTRAAGPAAGRWAWLLFGVGAVAAVVVLMPDAVLHGRVLGQADMLYDGLPWRAHLPQGYRPIERPPLGDVPMIVYPFLAFTTSRWWSGHFPIWTASIAAGQPFLATYHSALFSPFTWLTLLIPLPFGTVAMAVARLLVGGAGMFLFLRRLGLSAWAAAFGGITYLLNPFSVVVLEHPLASVLPWLPWMGVAAEAAVSGRALAIAALAITTALTLVGGHPHGGLFVAAFGSAYAILRAATVPVSSGAPVFSEAPAKSRRRALIAVSGALALGGLIACVQILPFLEYLSLSRGATIRSGYALNPYIAPVSTLITALVPNFLGHPSSGNFAGPTNYLEQQIYPGITTWLLAPLGLIAGVRRWRTWFFVSATVLVMLMMYGAPGMLQLVSMLPLLKAASLPRLAIIAIASLTVLAACGVDEVLRASRRRSSLVPIGTAAVLLAIIVAALVARRSELDAHALLDFVTRWAWLAAVLIAAACLVIAAKQASAIRTAPAGLALVVIAALDLLLFGRGFHPTLPPEQVFPPTPEIDRIQQDRDVFRVLGLGGAMLPNSAMVYGLQDLRGDDGLAVARYADLLDVVLTYEPYLHIAHSIAHAPLLDLLNVKYVFAPGDSAPPDGWSVVYRDEHGLSALWRNDRVYPRAWLVDGYVVLEGNAARRALRDARVDGHRVAILEQDPPAAERPTLAASTASASDLGRATIVHYADERVVIETEAADRRLLVLTDVQYPGWTVRVDDQPATLYRANFAFRSVSVPAGRHRVEFVYRPASFVWGVGLAGFACVALAGLIVRERATSPRATTSA